MQVCDARSPLGRSESSTAVQVGLIRRTNAMHQNRKVTTSTRRKEEDVTHDISSFTREEVLVAYRLLSPGDDNPRSSSFPFLSFSCRS